MLFWTTIKLAFRSLAANKLRTLLTMLGMIIGVGSVITMLALGHGMQQQVLSNISAMGKNLLAVHPKWTGTNGVINATRENLTVGDARALLRDVPQIRRVTPVLGRREQVTYLNKNTNCEVVGCATTLRLVRNYTIAKGRMFNHFETRLEAHVAVLGPQTAYDLFGVLNPIGQTINIAGNQFTVIGILKSKGSRGWFNPDNQVLIPYTTGMDQIFGRVYLDHIDMQMAGNANVEKVLNECISVLRRRHHLLFGDPSDFHIFSQEQLLQTVSRVTETLTLFLGAVAGISLLVGGIGIMNIMLVTVTERTREIGVRKAIGACNSDILRQFMLEAVLVSVLGGALGAAMGVALSHFIHFQKFVAQVQTSNVVIAMSIAAGIGIFFGYYPAWRAAQLNPIEALRYE